MTFTEALDKAYREFVIIECVDDSDYKFSFWSNPFGVNLVDHKTMEPLNITDFHMESKWKVFR